MKKIEELSYEEALAELEQIVQQLQQQSVSIEQLTVRSERAKALVVYCQKKLREVDAQLSNLFEEERLS